MISFATVTGTKRNVKAIADHGWGFLYSAAGRWPTYDWIEKTGIKECCGDSGAWHHAAADTPFDEAKYERFASEYILPLNPRFVMLPDIVGGGLASLDLSLRWKEKLRHYPHALAIVVQDGMEVSDVAPLLGPRVSLCVGGSTEWKLASMGEWCRAANKRGSWPHVCRVNTRRRIHQCEIAGARSFDGTSGSIYAETVPMIDRARHVRDIEGYLSRNPAC